MPRLPYYVLGAALSAGTYYGVTQWIYEPYTTVQVAAEQALEAAIFFNQRFLQRAQLLSRELTSGDSDAMQSLYTRCMLLREDALQEDVLNHDALFKVVDETVTHRCLPMQFREEDMAWWQTWLSATVYVAYIAYFSWVAKALDVLLKPFGGNDNWSIVACRRTVDAAVAKLLLKTISAPVQLLDWRSETEGASRQRGQLVDRELDKGELTDAQRVLEESNRGQKKMFDMYSVELSHDDRVAATAKLQAATRGVWVPTHLFVVHVAHWLDDLAARASFKMIVDANADVAALSKPPRLVTLVRPEVSAIVKEREELAKRFAKSNAEVVATDRHEAAAATRRGLSSQGIIDSPLAQRNLTNYAVTLRDQATRLYRFGYPWAASTETLRDLFAKHEADFACPVVVSGTRRFIDVDGEEGVRRRAAERARRQAEQDAWKSGREMKSHSNLPEPLGWGTVPKEAQDKRTARRSRMVEQMRLDDEKEAEEAKRLEKLQTTGARKDYFETHVDALPSPVPAPTALTAFGDPNAGRTAVSFDTPLTTADVNSLVGEHQSLAHEVREAVQKVAAEAEKRRNTAPASEEVLRDDVKWRVYGGRIRGATRTLRVIVADPVTPEALWPSMLKAGERLYEAENEAHRFQPASLAA